MAMIIFKPACVLLHRQRLVQAVSVGVTIQRDGLTQRASVGFERRLLWLLCDIRLFSARSPTMFLSVQFGMFHPPPDLWRKADASCHLRASRRTDPPRGTRRVGGPKIFPWVELCFIPSLWELRRSPNRLFIAGLSWVTSPHQLAFEFARVAVSCDQRPSGRKSCRPRAVRTRRPHPDPAHGGAAWRPDLSDGEHCRPALLPNVGRYRGSHGLSSELVCLRRSDPMDTPAQCEHKKTRPKECLVGKNIFGDVVRTHLSAS